MLHLLLALACRTDDPVPHDTVVEDSDADTDADSDTDTDTDADADSDADADADSDTDSDADADPVCAPLDPGVRHWHRYQDTLTATVGSDGVWQDGGAAAYAPGRVGQALVLDGSGGVTLFEDAAGDWPADSFTVEMWVNASSQKINLLSHYECGGRCPSGEAEANYSLVMNTNGQVYSWVRGDQGGATVEATAASAAGVLEFGAWHHVAAVRDVTAETLTVYVDGAVVAQAALAGDVELLDGDGDNDPIVVGGHQLPGEAAFGDWLVGSLDELTVYWSALSQEQVQAIVDAGDLGKCLE